MIRQKLTVGLIASAFTISLAPVWAGQRSSNGDTVGSAVPRDSGGGSSGSSSSGSGSSGSAGSSQPSGSRSGGGESQRAPREERVEQQQRRGGGSSSGRAVPRGSSGSGGATSSTAGSNGDRGEGRSRGEVPAYSRPRDGRGPLGTAVERRGALPGRGGGGVYYPGVIYDPYYYSSYYDPYYSGARYSSYWNPYGYGYGLGYFAYDPFLAGGYNRGYAGSYGGSGYDPYQGGYGSGGRYAGVGSIRLKVKPAEAQVHVDGYYVGVIDSFDGVFQRLGIEEGPHKVEVRADGYEPVQFDVMVIPGETITYQGELKRIP